MVWNHAVNETSWDTGYITITGYGSSCYQDVSNQGNKRFCKKFENSTFRKQILKSYG